MSREQPVLNWGEATTVDGRSGGVVKVVLNLLLVAALVAVLGPGRQLFYADVGVEEQARAVERLMTAFHEHLTRLGVVAGGKMTGGEQIELVGPPNGTLYERPEEITLRWSHNVPLKTDESYQVAVAYFKDFSVTLPVEPAFRYFSTTEETLQLPVLDVDSSMPIIVWTVYVASGRGNTPTGVVSGTYKVLHIVRPKFHGVYSWDFGF